MNCSPAATVPFPTASSPPPTPHCVWQFIAQMSWRRLWRRICGAGATVAGGAAAVAASLTRLQVQLRQIVINLASSSAKALPDQARPGQEQPRLGLEPCCNFHYEHGTRYVVRDLATCFSCQCRTWRCRWRWSRSSLRSQRWSLRWFDDDDDDDDSLLLLLHILSKFSCGKMLPLLLLLLLLHLKTICAEVEVSSTSTGCAGRASICSHCGLPRRVFFSFNFFFFSLLLLLSRFWHIAKSLPHHKTNDNSNNNKHDEKPRQWTFNYQTRFVKKIFKWSIAKWVKRRKGKEKNGGKTLTIVLRRNASGVPSPIQSPGGYYRYT